MQEYVHAIVLGLTQGLTEFIPVSSSGHVLLVGDWLQFERDFVFDMALNLGTLLALYLFFAKDFYRLGRDLLLGGPQRRLAVYLVAATVPGVLAGVALQGYIESSLRASVPLIAINLIWVGVMMWLVDAKMSQQVTMKQVRLPHALVVGLAQVAALIPGVSRSGSTITAGRLLGFDRATAVRFSFWLSAPITTGATLKTLVGDGGLAGLAAQPLLYAAGIGAAFVGGYLAIGFCLRFMVRYGLSWFAAYRIALGVALLTFGAR